MLVSLFIDTRIKVAAAEILLNTSSLPYSYRTDMFSHRYKDRVNHRWDAASKLLTKHCTRPQPHSPTQALSQLRTTLPLDLLSQHPLQDLP
jgi:hypothetical protein